MSPDILVNIGSDNGLPFVWCQAIIGTNLRMTYLYNGNPYTQKDGLDIETKPRSKILSR